MFFHGRTTEGVRVKVEKPFARAKVRTSAGKPTLTQLDECDAASVADLLERAGHPTRIVGKQAESTGWDFAVDDEGDGVVFLYAVDDRAVVATLGVPFYEEPSTPETIRAMDEKFAGVKPLLTKAGLSSERLEGYEEEPYWMRTHQSDERHRE